jgi:hypothetical protein
MLRRGRCGCAGCSGGDGFWSWGACSGWRMGERAGLSGRLWRRRHGSQNTGMAERVKPRSREAVRLVAQGFTRDDSPVRMNVGCWESGWSGDWSLVGRGGRFTCNLDRGKLSIL